MVQVIENRSVLDCSLVRVARAGDWTEAEVVVDRSSDVADLANLIRPGEAPVTIRLKEAVALPPRFRIEARLAAPGVIWGDAATVAPLP